MKRKTLLYTAFFTLNGILILLIVFKSLKTSENSLKTHSKESYIFKQPKDECKKAMTEGKKNYFENLINK
jgi:hypothetical protein